jgi:hypothetical protein
MGKDGAQHVSEVSEFSFPDTKDVVSFDLVKPDFAHDTYGSSPRFANEIYPKFYGEISAFPSVKWNNPAARPPLRSTSCNLTRATRVASVQEETQGARVSCRTYQKANAMAVRCHARDVEPQWTKWSASRRFQASRD